MSVSLPDRPDLEQLRRQAKELRDAARRGETTAVDRIAWRVPGPSGTVTLALAQLVIARELGYASWPKLKAAIEARADPRADAFVAASVEGRTREAARLLEDDPRIAAANVPAVAVLGDLGRLEDMVAADPSVAQQLDGERGWPPLLFACYSHWHRIDRHRTTGLVEVVRLLLGAGASPNTNNGARPHHGYRSALHGSVTVNNPGITAVLLERGANPNDGESLYQAAGHRDHQCLRLLLSSGAIVAGSWVLEVAVGADDAEGVRLVLDAAARQSPVHVAELASRVLAHAAEVASEAVVQALLAAGADAGTARPDGPSPLRQAVRAGKQEVAATLSRHGARQDATEIDRFLGACVRGDRAEAKRLLDAQPGLPNRLSDEDRAAIVAAAGSAPTTTVRLMLELGFSPHARNSFAETPLHTAAYAGRAETVQLLLDHGAEIDARDANFDGTPLGYATVGSGEHTNAGGDSVATVRLLLHAGASRAGAWVASKPPSEDVAEVLRNHGITAEDQAATRPPEVGAEADAIDPAVVREIAEQLTTAYRSLDLDLLSSLLHPNVHWGQGAEGCTNSDQVLRWYRRILAEGTHLGVEDVEVHGDTIALTVTLTRSAHGARPAPPQTIHQAFRIADATIIEIRGQPD